MPPLRAAPALEVSFAPDPALQARLDRQRPAIAAVWEEVRRQRGEAVFDGTLMAVTSVEERPGAALAIMVGSVPYSAYLAQRQGVPLGLHALGVSGLLVDRSAGLRALVGRRVAHLAQCAGHLEFPPSGGIDERAVGPGGRVDFVKMLLDELEEETGIDRRAVARVVPLGIIEDPSEHGTDICCRLELAAAPGELRSDEYEDLRWVTAAEARALAARERVVPTFAALAEEIQ